MTVAVACDRLPALLNMGAEQRSESSQGIEQIGRDSIREQKIQFFTTIHLNVLSNINITLRNDSFIGIVVILGAFLLVFIIVRIPLDKRIWQVKKTLIGLSFHKAPDSQDTALLTCGTSSEEKNIFGIPCNLVVVNSSESILDSLAKLSVNPSQPNTISSELFSTSVNQLGVIFPLNTPIDYSQSNIAVLPEVSISFGQSNLTPESEILASLDQSNIAYLQPTESISHLNSTLFSKISTTSHSLSSVSSASPSPELLDPL